SIGRCQRCQTVLEPRLSPQWFCTMKPLAEPALAAVHSGEVKIIPEHWSKTYEHWMTNIQDWCVSRQLWWGHQIPAWYCSAHDGAAITRKPDGDYSISPAATPIIAREAPKECPHCHAPGDKLVQDPDVLDTWFSSALWPFSTLGWPDDTADVKQFYPN